MSITVYDNITKSEVNLSDDTVFRIHDNRGITDLHLLPTGEKANQAYGLFDVMNSIAAYSKRVAAMAGRTLLVETAQELQRQHGTSTMVDLHSTFLVFYEAYDAGTATPTYAIDSLQGPDNVYLLGAKQLERIMHDRLNPMSQEVPLLSLPQLAVYTESRDRPGWRTDLTTFHTDIDWRPETYQGMPQNLIIPMKDLLTVDQRLFN